MGIQVEGLKDHADMLPHLVDIHTRCGNVVAVEVDRTARGFFQTITATKKRALSRSGWANDKNQFLASNFEIDAFQHFGFTEGLSKSLDLENRLSHILWISCRRRDGGSGRSLPYRAHRTLPAV